MRQRERAALRHGVEARVGACHVRGSVILFFVHAPTRLQACKHRRSIGWDGRVVLDGELEPVKPTCEWAASAGHVAQPLNARRTEAVDVLEAPLTSRSLQVA